MTRAPAPDLPRAGLPRRIASLGYETLLAAAIVLAGGFLAAPLVTPAGNVPGNALALPGPTGRWVGFALVYALLGAYFVRCWSGGRRTLPMKTWRMRLVRDDDSGEVGFRRALARYLAAGIGPALAAAAYAWAPSAWVGAIAAVGWVWALADPKRAFLHDRMAGTRLVADQRPAA